MNAQPQPGSLALAAWSLLMTAALAVGLTTPSLAQEAPGPRAAGPLLTLKKGDHIAFIGNTLADRMQHDGWVETYLVARNPQADLSIRNLGFSGDELTMRLRSADFGSPDDWLTRVKADVVFAFFGYNESFAGAAGLPKFRDDLASFIDHTLRQRYNGNSAPRLVLFSPIAHEDLKDPNLPDGKANNERLELYTKAMADVAAAKKVAFVDLFHPTKTFSDTGAVRPLTINGIHLNADGNRVVAQVIDSLLYGDDPAPVRDPGVINKIREAILEKNFYWFNRYRTVDGYSIFGGRADLRFTNFVNKDIQTNRDVAQREMEILDVMTANRDRKVWAAAAGQDLVVDDSDTPPFIPVLTNKRGNGPNGEHIFLSGDEAIGKMTVAKGLKVNLFASEKEFPELAKPVQMAFDPKGRLWVAAWPTYPHWKPKSDMNDKLLIFEDTNNDGKADRMTVFADKLHCPTGFEFYNGGVLLAQTPDLMFLKDTDGDGKADVRTRVLSGLDSADTHHASNSFTLDPGGALYFQEGTFHQTQVETPYGPPVRSSNAAVFRYEPRAQKFDVYVAYGFANPHGHVFDGWGRDIVVDGTGANPYHGALFSGHLEYPAKHGRPPLVYQQRTRPCPGIEYLTSKHFPESMQGHLLVANVIGFQGILQYRIDERGASIAGTEVEPLLSSSDPNFRPSDLKIAPDGSPYFLDWQNPIIGHMQHNLRDPSRDATHGRIYRVTAAGRPLNTPVAVADQPIPALLDLLEAFGGPVRTRPGRARLRDSKEVTDAANAWLAALDKADSQYEHQRVEALWIHQYHNVVNTDLLKQVLKAPDYHARAAATRVLCYWRDRVPEALDLLKTLAADPYPSVRLEAIRAASFFREPEALEVVLISAEQPSDEYLEYSRAETMKALQPIVRQAIADGRPIKFTSDAGARYFLRSVTTDDLLKMNRTGPVSLELLVRKGVPEDNRKVALADLAKSEKKSEARVLVETIQAIDGEKKNPRDTAVLFDLVRLLTDRPAAEVAATRPDLEGLATTGQAPLTRQLAYVALAAADGGLDKAWTLATRTPSSLQDLLGALPLVRDAAQRAALYSRVIPLLEKVPDNLASKPGTRPGSFGRYVRIELPGRQRTLTLAEVEVMSEGRNVARRGRAMQKNTSHGGDASHAIDGNTSGTYGDGGQTHSEEGTANPWWEVDLGAEMPIEEILVYNRNEGNLGSRLKGFTIKVLDQNHRAVLEQTNVPAPERRATIKVAAANPEGAIRRAAMTALPAIAGKEAEVFGAVAKFVKSGTDRQTAIAALQKIPTKYWPKDQAQPLLDSLIAYVKSVPVADRTTPGVVDALQFGESLASLLPRDDSLKVRRIMGELGVRVLKLSTVTDQMLFDKDRMAVRAGKPVEIVFENVDLMPHNFVVTQPGSLEEIGLLAESSATAQGALERGYIPVSPKILVASKLLQPRDAQTIRFSAPTKPGVYPYVCTYPGHWRRMYGALYVVEDLDDYLSDPESYLQRHPLPILDDLLKSNRPRKEWTFEELAAAINPLAPGRSYSSGKQMFLAASCVACHKLNGVGEQIGADLGQLDPKYTPADVLKNILNPSEKVDPKYQTYLFETTAGRVVTGLVIEEKPDSVKIIENPLAKSEPVVLRKADIADRVKSPNSLMPKGLLDKLTREEVLDLVAYVFAKGDPKHPVYQGGHNHGAGSGHGHGGH
ncbi:MAG: PVC-type heme-binding CxxCH protein [Isosphaeraceae bacterium]